MATETPEEKKFRIQLGVVQRTFKEHKSYIDETAKGIQEINVMKNGPNPDDYKLRKMAEVVEENRKMIGDAARRLAFNCAELKRAITALGRPDDDAGIVSALDLIERSRQQVEANEKS